MLMDGLAMDIHVGLLIELDGEVTMPQLLLHRSPVSMTRQHWQCIYFVTFEPFCCCVCLKWASYRLMNF